MSGCPVVRVGVCVLRNRHKTCRPGTGCCKRQANAINLAYILLTTICKHGISSFLVSRRACCWQSTMGNCLQASSLVYWGSKPSIFMAPQAMNSDISCPTTSCNGKPCVGPSNRGRSCTISGVFPQLTIKMRTWQACTASNVAGEVKWYAALVAMNGNIVPWQCVWLAASFQLEAFFARPRDTIVHYSRRDKEVCQCSAACISPRDFCGEQRLQHINVRGAIQTINGFDGSNKDASLQANSAEMQPTGGRRQKQILTWRSRWRIMPCALASSGAALSL